MIFIKDVSKPVSAISEPVRSRDDDELRAILDALPAAAYLCDAAGLITYFNQPAVALWGRVPLLNDAADRYCGSLRLYTPDGEPVERDRSWMALALQHDCEYSGRDMVIERPDGRRVTALAHALPLHDTAGRVRGAVNVLVDLTDPQAALEALRAANRCREVFLGRTHAERRAGECPARAQYASGASDESGDQGARTAVRPLRVLVVDDNVDSAVTMAALLGMQGHEVRTAHDGLEALEEVERFRPDVVILDIGMPRMNGYTAAAHIRARMDEVQPLLIAVTGWGQPEDRHRSKEAGFDHHLVKPVDPAVLFDLIASPSRRPTLH